MKKLFCFFAIFLGACIANTRTAYAASSDIKEITAKWELTTEPAGYEINISNYSVTAQNTDCTSELDAHGLFKHTSRKAEKTFKCPKNITTLTLDFKFHTAGSNLSNFSKTLNINNKTKYKIETAVQYNETASSRLSKLNTCKTYIQDLFEDYCKDEGFIVQSTGTPSLGQYSIDNTNATISLGCYKYKRDNSKENLREELAEKCKISKTHITTTNPRRNLIIDPKLAPITVSARVYLGTSENPESVTSPVEIYNKTDNTNAGTTQNNGSFSIEMGPYNVYEFHYNDDYRNYSNTAKNIQESPTIYLEKYTVFGTIDDKDEHPIMNATVKNTRTNKTDTLIEGHLTFLIDARPGDTLEFSADGYESYTYTRPSEDQLAQDQVFVTLTKQGQGSESSIRSATTTETTNNFPISGTVIDDQNNHISDATVTIKDTSCSAKTGTDGKWRIDSCEGKPTLAQSDKLSITHNDYPRTEILLSELPANHTIILSKTAAESTNIQSTDQQQPTSENKSETPSKPNNESDTNSGKKNNQESDKETAAPKLSREDSQKKIDELQKNADAMKEKEQSTANKLLGGAAIGATGIGAMQAASAYSEQQADEEAEQAMRAYLATFHCNYGGGINVPGGEKDVQLPGGNELIDLYAEYVNLANNLKVRKAALDLRPGIESEAILDSATSGLYDDVAIGKTSGAFTSLARALQDPDGEDAKAWAAQKDASAKKMKTGLTVAGIGAIGGAVGNLIINKDAPKENSKEINAKYEKLKKKLEADIAAIPPQTAQCPSGTSGNKHPNCTCNDTSKIFNPDTNACDSCSGGKIAQNGECVCPSDKPLWDNANNQCIARPTSCTPQCTPTEGDHLIVKQDCSCTCSDGYDYQDGKCTCTGDNKTEENGKCITTEIITEVIQTFTNTSTSKTVENAVLPAGSLFEIGSYDLLDQAKTALNTFVTGLKDGGFSECELTITGYTDPVGGDATNKTLSTNRANSVKTHITGLNSTAIKTVNAEGKGEDNCTCGTRKSIPATQINYSDREYKACKNKEDTQILRDNARFAPCRRVEISASCKKITTTSESSTSTTTN